MDAFWKWMEEKGYGYLDANKNPVIINPPDAVDATKQMLIGYMMEYCYAHEIEFIIDHPVPDEDTWKRDYDGLVRIIERGKVDFG